MMIPSPPGIGTTRAAVMSAALWLCACTAATDATVGAGEEGPAQASSDEGVVFQTPYWSTDQGVRTTGPGTGDGGGVAPLADSGGTPGAFDAGPLPGGPDPGWEPPSGDRGHSGAADLGRVDQGGGADLGAPAGGQDAGPVGWPDPGVGSPDPGNGPAPDPGTCVPVAERCNGQDDDCDGFVDEETTDCDDQIACTADSCEASGCHHVPDDSLCDDSNSCTDDSCDWQTGCAYRLMEGPPCDDGNPCTTGDTCDETGSCTGEPIADCCSEHLHCDDGNVCTTDRCEQGTCLSFPAPVGVTCDDGDPCTEQDGCFNGACSGVPISCDDSNPCTDDLCSGGSCSNTRSSDGQHCDDGDPCTTGDACSSGHCAGETTDCDDGEPCTADSCAGGGCIHGELPDGSSCPGGVCQGGSCRLTDGARLVAAGGEHSCAVRQSGAVLCWGSNASGQLGDGSTVLFRPAPSEPVSALEAPVALGAGTSHTCAVAADGAAHCWGSNATGQLGDPDAGFERRTPFPVLGLSDAASIDGGHEHTCARRRSGAIWCWGSDIHGRLGNGHHFTGEVHYTAVEVNNIWAATDVAAGGDHGCAAVNTGRVWCWGRNMHGEIGDGTSGGGAEHDFPVEVHELSSATAVATGHQHSCAAEADGTVWCWGRGMRGQIGHGGSGQLIGATTPHVATGVFDAIDVAAGQEHTCALTGGGQVWCWGAGTDGQIGDGGTTDRTYPTRVQSLPPTAALSVGRSHSCALARGGAVYCWGSNSSGQIGDGTSGGLRPLPVRVQGF